MNCGGHCLDTIMAVFENLEVSSGDILQLFSQAVYC